MGSHFGEIKRGQETPKEWLAFGATMTELGNKWALRGDLIATVGPHAAEETGAPAAFDPLRAEIMVNTDVAFGKLKPHKIGDFSDRAVQFEFAKATGAIWHEAMHARFTTWDLYASSKALTPNENAALHLLEETRMEGLGIRSMPNMKNFIRACALEIVIGDVKEAAEKTSDTRAAAHLAALTIGRVDTGTLDAIDILAIEEKIMDVLGQPLFEDLQMLWRKFQSISRVSEPSDIAELYRIAKEWNRIVQDAAEERGEGKERANGNGFEGDGSGGGSGMMKEIMEALGEDAEATEISAGGALGDQEKAEQWAASAAASNAAHEEHKANEQVFRKIVKEGEEGRYGASRARVTSRRQPTPDEHRAAVRLARELDKAKYQDRLRVEGDSPIPPGRLRTGAAVQDAASISQGLPPTAAPWRKVQRKHVDDPNLTIGVMVDISGSMSAAMEPMASAAWILSDANKRVEATSAMVYYGNSVFPTLRPGQTLREVQVYNAADGTEEAETAFQALDGALDLINGKGARLVVIVSDGQYRGDMRPKVTQWLSKFEKAGVGVLWLAYGYADEAERHCREHRNAESIRIGDRDSTVRAAGAIGAAAVKAINAAGTLRR